MGGLPLGSAELGDTEHNARECARSFAAASACAAEDGCGALAVFGSIARDEAEPESDVDLLVKFARSFYASVKASMMGSTRSISSNTCSWFKPSRIVT